MMKLKALNALDEVDTSEVEEEEYLDLEKLLIDEYKRALRLQEEKQNDAAIGLFQNLLETELLHQTVSREVNPQLYQIKHNCLKQLGFLCQLKGENESAIRYWLDSGALDNSDVFMLKELGQLALKMWQLPLAGYAFKECLKHNENHFEANDGLLQCLYLDENYVEAYGWALYLLTKNNDYKRGHFVIRRIRERFQGSTLTTIESFFTATYQPNPRIPDDCVCTFPEPIAAPLPVEPNPVSSITSLKLRELSWMSIADFIISLQSHYGANSNIQFMFDFDDILDDSLRMENETDVNDAIVRSMKSTKSKTQKVDSLQVANGNVAKKSNCSVECDGKGLEAMLLKAIPDVHKYEYVDNNLKNNYDVMALTRDRPVISVATFQKKFNNIFQYLLRDLRSETLTIISMICKWLESIEVFYDKPIPVDIMKKFIEIHELHMAYSHGDCWFLYERTKFEKMFMLGIFYLELRFDDLIDQQKKSHDAGNPRFEEFVYFFKQILCTPAPNISTEMLPERMLRLQFIEAHHIDIDRDRAIHCLMELKTKLGSNQLVLEGQTFYNITHGENLREAIQCLELQSHLDTMGVLYAQKDYAKLKNILESSLTHSVQMKPFPFTTQFEVLLECLWQSGDQALVMRWAERYLNYAVEQWLATKKRFTKIKATWLESILFALKYIDSLLDDDNSGFCVQELEEYVGRLMKNLVKLIAIHMDENNKSLKLIDLFTSLHKLLLQIELNSVNDLPFGSKDSTASNIDSLPCALQIFATAHQYLLQNNRCLENGGEVLLHVFDLILKYQQNSISATDKVSNLLRQMANSLFGVTLEDIGRDYLPIDSTRQRQIFDIFRPVNLHVSSMTDQPPITERFCTVIMTIIKDIPQFEQDILRNRRNIIKAYICGAVKDLPATELNITTIPYPEIFDMIGDYHLRRSMDYKRAAAMFLWSMAVRTGNYDLWLALAMAKIRLFETNFCSTDLTNRRSEMKTMENEIMVCCIECMCTKIDGDAIKLFGEFAYNYQANNFYSSSRDTINRPATLTTSAAECVELLLIYFHHKMDYKLCLRMALYLLEETASEQHHDLSFFDQRRLMHKAVESTIQIVHEQLDALSMFNPQSNDESQLKALILLTDVYELHSKFRDCEFETKFGLITSLFLKGYCIHMDILTSIENCLRDEDAYYQAILLCETQLAAAAMETK